MCKPMVFQTAVVHNTDDQFNEALAAALFANPKQFNRSRMEGFGRSISPVDKRKTFGSKLSNRLTLTKESMKRKMSVKSHRSAVLDLAAKFDQTDATVAPIEDELKEIRKLRGEERLVRFFEIYDPSRCGDAKQLLDHGGTTEPEMWDKLMLDYRINQRRRLWLALKVCVPDAKIWHRNVDCYLAECNSAVEVELMIAVHTKHARHLVEKREEKEADVKITWSSGISNSYQNIPEMELDD